KEIALPYFRRAIELEPGGAAQLYSLMDQHGVDQEEIIRLTPAEPDAMIQLCRFLGSKASQKKFEQCVIQLSQLKLDAQQQLDTASLAAQAGLVDIAVRFEKAASTSAEMKLQALQLLVEEAWKEQKFDDYMRYSAMVEKTQLER